MQIFKKLFSQLNANDVRYLVAGGIAVNLYGIERATADIDIVLDLDTANTLRFAEVARSIGLKPKVPVKIEDFADKQKRNEWIETKDMKVFSLYDPQNPFFILDIFVEEPFDFEGVYKMRRKFKFEDIIIPTVPIEELIKMKETTGRPQDKADAFHLKKIMGEWKHERESSFILQGKRRDRSL